MKTNLVSRTTVPVRFSEIDALSIVWHGHYLRYFEDGREAFGKEFGMGYTDVYKHGFATPLVNINVDYRKTVRYGDSVMIETSFISNPAAKLIFRYIIRRVSDNEIVATGESTQVFMTLDHQLHITKPRFFEEWLEMAEKSLI